MTTTPDITVGHPWSRDERAKLGITCANCLARSDGPIGKLTTSGEVKYLCHKDPPIMIRADGADDGNAIPRTPMVLGTAFCLSWIDRNTRMSFESKVGVS